MGCFKAAFSALSMATTGKVITQIDTPIMHGKCEISLRLKRKDDDSDGYVVLAGLARGNYQFYPMHADEFIRFADAVQTIKSELSNLNRR
jgi:hypothetical protein